MVWLGIRLPLSLNVSHSVFQDVVLKETAEASSLCCLPEYMAADIRMKPISLQVDQHPCLQGLRHENLRLGLSALSGTRLVAP